MYARQFINAILITYIMHGADYELIGHQWAWRGNMSLGEASRSTGFPMDPRIGALANGTFYAYASGYDAEPFMGTRGEVEAALGLAPSANSAEGASFGRRASVAKSAPARCYDVLVSPSVVVHVGAWSGGPYVERVSARSHAQAISKARAMRRDNEGRLAAPATYKATLSKD